MEPCPYRQGEEARPTRGAPHNPPQWSPALIGRESAYHLYAAVGGDWAAMEPCPYRQGEPYGVAVGVGSKAAAMEPCPYRQGEIGSPRRTGDPCAAAMEPCPYRQGEPPPAPPGPGHRVEPQWSPALIGRESV